MIDTPHIEEEDYPHCKNVIDGLLIKGWLKKVDGGYNWTEKHYLDSVRLAKRLVRRLRWGWLIGY